MDLETEWKKYPVLHFTMSSLKNLPVGVTKFSQLSIFSELNNLLNISMMPEYSGLCGITKDELEGVLRPCVEDFAEGYGCTVDEAYALLKRQYDGYHFCEDGKDVFSPFSLLRALSARKPGDYWYESSTSLGIGYRAGSVAFPSC